MKNFQKNLNQTKNPKNIIIAMNYLYKKKKLNLMNREKMWLTKLIWDYLKLLESIKIWKLMTTTLKKKKNKRNNKKHRKHPPGKKVVMINQILLTKDITIN